MEELHLEAVVQKSI